MGEGSRSRHRSESRGRSSNPSWSEAMAPLIAAKTIHFFIIKAGELPWDSRGRGGALSMIMSIFLPCCMPES